MIDKTMTRGLSVGALALLSACGHLPIAEPAFEALSAKRAGIPTDWTVAPMTRRPGRRDFRLQRLPGRSAGRLRTGSTREQPHAARCDRICSPIGSPPCGRTRSALFPQVGASVGLNTSAPTDDLNNDFDQYSFALSARYNADIMGDLGASIQASAAGLRSTEAVYEQTRRQIAAQVARSYFIVIEQGQQLDLDRKSLERQRQTFRIAQTRFDAGSIARDELVLGESRLAQAEELDPGQRSLGARRRAGARTGPWPLPAEQAEHAGDLPEPPTSPPLGLPELTIARVPMLCRPNST